MWRARSAPCGWWRRAGAPVRDEPSDDQLIDGLRKREPAALGALHDRYSGGIYNLALRMVRSDPDAEDITHDVLLRAYERLPSDKVVDLRPWLYRVTLNRCYDVLRTAKRLGETNGDQTDETATRVDPYAPAELAGLVTRALDALTPRQRAAMLLKDVHGLSLCEVAATLHITVGSAEVLLARARNVFRARFDGLCPGEAAGTELGHPGRTAVALAPQPLPPALAAPPAAPIGTPPTAATTPSLSLAARRRWRPGDGARRVSDGQSGRGRARRRRRRRHNEHRSTRPARASARRPPSRRLLAPPGRR